jgi:plastocyanin
MKREPLIGKTILRGVAILFLLTAISGCKRSPPPTSGDASVSGASTPDAVSGSVTIILQENAFHPDRLTVKAGTTVSWINKDPAFHSIRSDSDVFHSGMLAIGQMFSFTFDETGTYPYYCEKNGGPDGTGMSGVITVVP